MHTLDSMRTSVQVVLRAMTSCQFGIVCPPSGINHSTMLETPDIPHDSAQEIIVPVEQLTELLVTMYVKKGMLRADAEMVAARQVEADWRGIHSHGSRATPRYLAAMDAGNINPRGQVQSIKADDSDCGHGWRPRDGTCRLDEGYVVGDRTRPRSRHGDGDGSEQPALRGRVGLLAAGG